jgi:ferredoxin
VESSSLQLLLLHRPDSSLNVAIRIHLDISKCQGHNRCYAIAPELFDVDEYGQAVLRITGTIPPELEKKARLAAANCPEFAIEVVEEET